MTMSRFEPTVAGAAVLVCLAGFTAACQEKAPDPAPAGRAGAPEDPAAAAREKLIARARPLELPTAYEPPPGDALEHHTSGYAKTMCSAVFITGLDVDVAAEHVGYFTGPYEERKKVGKPVVDRAKKSVSITLPERRRATAATPRPGLHHAARGPDTCPSRRRPSSPTCPGRHRTGRWATACPRPAAGRASTKRRSNSRRCGVRTGRRCDVRVRGHLQGPAGRRALRQGITPSTPLESWSMGKSVTATIMGMLIHKGVYTLDQPAPIPEWQAPGDPRQHIRIQDILHMSSGIRIKAPSDPDFDPNGTVSRPPVSLHRRRRLIQYAATRPPQWPPNTVGRYRNTDPVLTNYLNSLGVEKLRRRLPVVPAAQPLRQDRGADDGDGDRSVRKLPDPGLRTCRAVTGRASATLSAERRGAERRAHPARGLRGVRQHGRAGVGGRRASGLRRLLLDQRRRRVAGAERGVLDDRGRRADGLGSCLRTIW